MADQTLADQWRNPTDVLSILLLWSPETVQRAIAQLTGRRITPVAFSFGWVAYSANALLSVFSDGKLMPQSDVRNLLIIGAESGFVRQTSSWVLGRLFRDLDSAADNEMDSFEADHLPPIGSVHKPARLPAVPSSEAASRSWEALRVSVYRVVSDRRHVAGVPHIDWVWIISWLCIVIQLAISVIPWALDQHAQWAPFLITLCGTSLSLLTGSLPQWTQEKWACPKSGGATVALTQSNGYRHAIVVLGQAGVGMDIEVLAAGTRTSHSSSLTRVLSAIFAAMWLLLLICVAGMKDNAWYLLGIGLIGSVQNIVAGAVPRTPSALGFHLDLVEVLRGGSVAELLKVVEARYPFVGSSLMPIFFPASSTSIRIAPADVAFWKQAHELRHQENKHGIRLDDALHISQPADETPGQGEISPTPQDQSGTL